MVLIFIAILLGIAFLVWLWKGPLKKTVKAMKESGSSTAEAYIIITLLTAGLAVTIYMIFTVV